MCQNILSSNDLHIAGSTFGQAEKLSDCTQVKYTISELPVTWECWSTESGLASS